MGDLNREYVGKSYPPKTFTVEAERTIAYALATNDENPWYVDRSREGGIIAPPLFAVAPAGELLIESLTDMQLGVPLDRTLHGEQDMYFISPIRPGDKLVTEAKILDMTDTSTGETMTTEVVTKTEGGELRCRSLAIAYVRHPEKKKNSQPEPEVDRGASLVEQSMKVTDDQPLRYAEASGDHNPPHVNEDFAKAIGFRTVILQGLCTMAFTSMAVIDALCAGNPTRLKRLKVRFSKVVYPGDVLTTSIWTQGGNYTFQTANQDGVLVIKDGVAEIES